mmetsp:Transcript_23774/g.65798  ORF Transcript_23774/g.65798 Transcript_23774/m.65798 type:complete len:173 (+) Transcript_23774:59-577(+)
MEATVRNGLAKNIGVCNFNSALLRDLIAGADVPPAVLQIELHPYNQQPKLVRFAQEQGLVVTGFSPLGAGSYVELDMASASDSALHDPTIKQIASKYQVAPAQVMLRWGIQRGVSVVPKSTKSERLRQNLDVASFNLDDDDMQAIAKLDQGRRYNDPGVFAEGMGAFLPIYD